MSEVDAAEINVERNGTTPIIPSEMLPSEKVLEDEAREAKEEEERRENREPPVVFTNIDLIKKSNDYENSSATTKLHKLHVGEVRIYIAEISSTSTSTLNKNHIISPTFGYGRKKLKIVRETNTDSEQDGTELDDTIQNTTEPESCDEDDRPQIDYDIEVTDLYDDIDLNDTNQKDLLSSEDIHPSKRARLDINYSIGPAGTFQSLNGSQQPQQNRRKMTLVNRIV